MKRKLVMALATLTIAALTGSAQAEDPFAAGDDALAVKDSDGASSVRAKLKLKKMLPDMVLVKVKGVNDAKYPNCILSAQVLRAATSKAKHFKLIGRGKVYRFKPVLKKKGRSINLKHKMTQNNLGACYYPARTKLAIRVSGVDLKAKAFKAAEIYLK